MGCRWALSDFKSGALYTWFGRVPSEDFQMNPAGEPCADYPASPDHIRAQTYCSGEIGPRDIGGSHVDASEVCALQVAKREINKPQIISTKITASQIGAS
jgi:hypothetical protein